MAANGVIKGNNKAILIKIAGFILLLIPYFLYLAYIVRTDHGPVDYETFMAIGHRMRTGAEIYRENSYYPLPYVCIFAVFDWLPRSISMTIWFLAPVVMAIIFSGFNPLVLIFAPVFGNFVGGQTAAIGMLGLWGYRKYNDLNNYFGGIFLALIFLKPQLGIVPFAFAAIQWLNYFRRQKNIPHQAWAWVVTMSLLYFPCFFIKPDWFTKWLSNPRPLAERAMSGFVPRTMLLLIDHGTSEYWLAILISGVLLFAGIWYLNKKTVTLDLTVLWGFIVSPIVHDYDLIQIVPLLEEPKIMIAAVLSSIPGWLVILFAYDHDSPWYWFSIIAPGILCALLSQSLIKKDAREGESGVLETKKVRP